MSKSQNFWKEDGTPRRKLPKCVFCGEDKLGSEFDDAWCLACNWKGSFTDLLLLEFKARPGARLLEYLDRHGISLSDFALWNGLGANRQAALANIRRYTHPTAKLGPKSPSDEMLNRWAKYLGVDAGSFYRARAAKE